LDFQAGTGKFLMKYAQGLALAPRFAGGIQNPERKRAIRMLGKPADDFGHEAQVLECIGNLFPSALGSHTIFRK
jgi:hypothetical protein